MKVSVIISVYNHFEWLRLILDALRMQTYKNFEVVIADDGSSKETVYAIQKYMAEHPELKIIHSWQEDEGWRKNRALNNAVRMSAGEYIIFMDGDCIPHPRFVEDHIGLSKQGRVVAGRRIDLPPKNSDEIGKLCHLSAGYFQLIRGKILRNLLSFDADSFKALKRIIHFPVSNNRVFGMKPGGILGCNFSLYREDLMRINGFDERYVNPGVGEDTDLDLRLCNAGMEVQKVSRAALMLHRNHPRLPMDSEENRQLLETHRRQNATWINTGLQQ